MKTIIYVFLTVALIFSCKKEGAKLEYINYDSEIFTGSDTLIYGQWKYLYSLGGIAVHKVDFGGSLLSITPIGNYAAIFKDNFIANGKILLEEKQYNHTRIRFCKDGIKNNVISSPNLIAIPKLVYFNNPDTLILVDPCCDLYEDFYERIK